MVLVYMINRGFVKQ